ncbi:hypothetical protein N431DRAFT_436802 [Stipitochalara longipes BDJ]|nr:hypothetical protein N431DRAFT_436802 [Stipitochalara longipes BDJ]
MGGYRHHVSYIRLLFIPFHHLSGFRPRILGHQYICIPSLQSSRLGKGLQIHHENAHSSMYSAHWRPSIRQSETTQILNRLIFPQSQLFVPMAPPTSPRNDTSMPLEPRPNPRPSIVLFCSPLPISSLDADTMHPPPARTCTPVNPPPSAWVSSPPKLHLLFSTRPRDLPRPQH